MVIELGGKIFLHDVEELDNAEVLIIKKLVGSYIRKVCDVTDCEQTDITFAEEQERFSISVKAKTKEQEVIADAQGKNVFMTLDSAMKAALNKLNIKM